MKSMAAAAGVLTCLLFSLPALATSTGASLVSHGRPTAVIVVSPDKANGFAAEELQRYFMAFTGAKLEIVTPTEARRRPSSVAWVLVGGPQTNELVREAAASKLVDFDNLKTDGFILRTIQIEGRRALVAGGNGETATIYAAYDLLERYGATFLLTGDILPEKTDHLQLHDFNVRSEPAFRRRGFMVSFIYPNRSIMSMKDEEKFLNQMMKLKMNYLMIFQFPYEPWVKYDYHGEVKWMGDIATKETSYVLWARDFGPHTTTGMIGEEHFKAAGVYPRLEPPEFQHVENNADAFAAAHQYLHNVIAYAATKKIKVWLAIDATSAVPNLARYTTRTFMLPFHFVDSTFICPNNPVSWDLNQIQLQGLVQAYPQAEGYFLTLPEHYPVCDQTEKDREFYQKLRPLYPGEARARAAFTVDMPQNDDTVVDSNAGSLFMIQKLIDSEKQTSPKVKLGIAGLGRLYLAPYIDKMFSKDVAFSDMESSAVWTPTGVPMHMFGDMRGHDVTLMNRIDDDSGMLGMQFSVNLYYKDHVLEDGLKYGLAGFDSQVNRARGTETNSKYMAEGEWNPHLTPDEFYKDYATRIFGERAAPKMIRAFDILEKNEEYQGWRGADSFLGSRSPVDLNIAREYSQQPDMFDGPHFPRWQNYIGHAHDDITLYTGSIQLLRDALAEMKSAQPLAAPRSQAYLAFLTNRTEAYILHLETLIAWKQAYIDLDNDFRAKAQGIGLPEFTRRLDATLEEFKEVHEKGKATAEKWSQLVDDPSDLGVLYLINTFMVTGTDLTVDLMQDLDNFYHGRDYVKPVEWGKVYVNWPVLKDVSRPDRQNPSALQ